jgi:uncharacterized protein YhbP (UPF0306 family)
MRFFGIKNANVWNIRGQHVTFTTLALGFRAKITLCASAGLLA